MEDIVDLIATDSSASDVSDKLKEILYAKAAERIDIARPYVANAMFGQEFEYPEVEDETESEVTDEPAEEEPSAEIETETDTEEESEE
tara:strand:+ start:213 stop:476 length:264 start_codon:yes stop_codon:yes gene_type:complete